MIHMALAGTRYSYCAPSGIAPRFTPPRTTTDPSKVTCTKCLKYADHFPKP
jgi:hypothetical protein